jgi:hypothetical protein
MSKSENLHLKPAVAFAAAVALVFAAASAQAEQAKKPAPAPAAPAAAQYKTEAEAKGKCGADVVVWVNTSTKVYHYAGNADYGKTKKGAFECEKEAAASGAHAAKNEKRPG